MQRVDRLLLPLLLASAALVSCAGGGGPPAATGDSASVQSRNDFQDLLARLDILIAASDGDASVPGAVVAEARALRIEALSALAAGDDALAHDLLTSAIALFGDGRG